jgi:phage protein D
MYYVADKQKAERALIELRAARTEEQAQALACLQRLRNEVAGAQRADHARMEAWISIRRLYDAVKAAPERDLKVLWQDAITKTAAWQASLR